jgi:hypothetical protein
MVCTLVTTAVSKWKLSSSNAVRVAWGHVSFAGAIVCRRHWSAGMNYETFYCIMYELFGSLWLQHWSDRCRERLLRVLDQCLTLLFSRFEIFQLIRHVATLSAFISSEEQAIWYKESHLCISIIIPNSMMVVYKRQEWKWRCCDGFFRKQHYICPWCWPFRQSNTRKQVKRLPGVIWKG